jgi:hypothetical protein
VQGFRTRRSCYRSVLEGARLDHCLAPLPFTGSGAGFGVTLVVFA